MRSRKALLNSCATRILSRFVLDPLIESCRIVSGTCQVRVGSKSLGLRDDLYIYWQSQCQYISTENNRDFNYLTVRAITSQPRSSKGIFPPAQLYTCWRVVAPNSIQACGVRMSSVIEIDLQNRLALRQVEAAKVLGISVRTARNLTPYTIESEGGI